ncbi:MAG TPA: NAD(P)H-dependent oxidoreductase [Bdellovibrio sp.]|nr:NAD(P)H-dependent oxidoreductase [Bdellovibrio sp.]
MKNILILNGSPSGTRGNCSVLIAAFKKFLEGSSVKVDVVHLKTTSFGPGLKNKIKKSSAMIFVTGTYWDSWGSPLQKFLEDCTELEGSSMLLGKPCAVFVLMHSVGGKSVLSRLQGVLSTMGFLIPPMSGMVYSLVNDLALKSRNPHTEDFWQIKDATLVLENLLKATDLKISWTSWPVDKKNFRRRWMPRKAASLR